jgi:hypothetical protein
MPLIRWYILFAKLKSYLNLLELGAPEVPSAFSVTTMLLS